MLPRLCPGMAAIFKAGTRLRSVLPRRGPAVPRALPAGLWAREDTRQPRGRAARLFVQPPRRQPGSATLRPPAGLAPCRGASGSAPATRGWEEPARAHAEQFKLVYKFPGIKYCRIFSRLKLLQTGLTIAILPPVCHLYLQEQISQALLLYVSGIAGFAAAMLYGTSYFFRRMIGLIYLNDVGTMVKVAHLTFWGKKREIYCPVETVIPLGDTGDVKNEVLLQFKQLNSTEVLYFTLKFGHIVDKQRFDQIFGGYY